MSIDTKAPEQPPTPVGPPIAMRDVTALLVRHYGLHVQTGSQEESMIDYQRSNHGLTPFIIAIGGVRYG